MGMFSEIATESTIKAIVHSLRALRDQEQDEVAREAYRKAILVCLSHFEWKTPDWARGEFETFT